MDEIKIKDQLNSCEVISLYSETLSESFEILPYPYFQIISIDPPVLLVLWPNCQPPCLSICRLSDSLTHPSMCLFRCRLVLLSSFLMNLIWHSHNADLCICYLASRNHSSCESDVTKRRLTASLPLGCRRSTCFQINLQIKPMCCTSIMWPEMLKSDSWPTLAPFFPPSFLSLLPHELFILCLQFWVPILCCSYIGCKSCKSGVKSESKSHVSPAAFIPEKLLSISDPCVPGLM